MNSAAYIRALAEKEAAGSQKFEEFYEIFKWNLLDMAIKDCCTGIRLVDLQKDPILFERINEHFSNMNKFKAP